VAANQALGSIRLSVTSSNGDNLMDTAFDLSEITEILTTYAELFECRDGEAPDQEVETHNEVLRGIGVRARGLFVRDGVCARIY
jgi:hypothetical protein